MKRVKKIIIRAWSYYVESNSKLYKPMWDNGLPLI